MHAKDLDQLRDTYERMAIGANYRPAAPSDGYGNIDMPTQELDLEQEAARYATAWMLAEDGRTFWIGAPDSGDRPAMVFIIEAARALANLNYDLATDLLEMAFGELYLADRHHEKP